VGLASPVVRGEEDRELTFEVRDGAMGSGTTTTGALPVASRPKAGSAMGLARQGRGWCNGVGGAVTGVGDDDGGTAGGIEAEGGVGNEVGTMGSRMVQQGRG
jgi:hypothetical protein